MYSIPQIARKLGMEYRTAWDRAHSKYAEYRWGVVYVELPDGSKKPYVPEEKLYLWLTDKRVTKPSTRELADYRRKQLL